MESCLEQCLWHSRLSVTLVEQRNELHADYSSLQTLAISSIMCGTGPYPGSLPVLLTFQFSGTHQNRCSILPGSRLVGGTKKVRLFTHNPVHQLRTDTEEEPYTDPGREQLMERQNWRQLDIMKTTVLVYFLCAKCSACIFSLKSSVL